MKTSRIYRYVWLMILIAGWTTAQGQYEQEVPGDNFSLEGALELFKQSESPEEFEKKLNHPEEKVNNLDLNGDGYIDYIRVIDLQENNVHAFVLQSVISHNEFQDIAVITLEKREHGNAVLQITGDADIYGVETIIEPSSEVRTYAGTTSSRAVSNVWAWPMVRYVYSPHYSVWVSPWGWGYRPRWWSPWRPVYYHDYYSYWRPYRRHYSVCYTHRVVYAHKIYKPHRSTSVIVHTKHNNSITKYRSRHIDSDGTHRRSNQGSYYRPSSAKVRYDAKGRIRSGSNNSVENKSYKSSRDKVRSANYNQRSERSKDGYISSGRSSQARSNGAQQRSADMRSNSSSKRNSATNSRSYSSGNKTSTKYRNNGSSSSQGNGRTYSRSSSSNQRSSSAPQVQRSTQRSNSGSNYRRSSGSASTQKYSGRSPNVQRSSGSSNVRQSSGSSNARKSTSSSQVRRSSGSSNSQGSSSRSSSSSRSGRSGSSSSRNRN